MPDIPTFYQCTEVDMQIFCILISFWRSRVQLVHTWTIWRSFSCGWLLNETLVAHIFSYSVKDHICPLSYTFSHLVRYVYKEMLLILLCKDFFLFVLLSLGLWIDICCRLCFCSWFIKYYLKMVLTLLNLGVSFSRGAGRCEAQSRRCSGIFHLIWSACDFSERGWVVRTHTVCWQHA